MSHQDDKDFDHDSADPGIDCEPTLENPDCLGCLSASLHAELRDSAKDIAAKIDAYEDLVEQLVVLKKLPMPRVFEIGRIIGMAESAVRALKQASDYWDDCLDSTRQMNQTGSREPN